MNTLLSKLRALFRRKSAEAEMAEEMRQHLERRIQEKIADGVAPAEARYSTQREFGGLAQIQEQCRDERRFVLVEQAGQDVRYAARSLRKNFGFATVVILTLAFGIGATTTLFSVVNRVMIRPLPYHEPERLVRVWDTNAKRGLTNFPASAANFISWQQESRLFAGLAAWRYGNATLASTGAPERIEVVRITGNLLSLLGLSPIAGRDFSAAEDRAGADQVVLISDRFWRERFQRSRAAVGETLMLDGVAHSIIGVAPTQLAALAAADVWKPMAANSNQEARSMHWLRVIGRLKPGVALPAAQREMDAITGRLANEFPDSNENWGVRLETFHDWIVPTSVRKALLVLFGAVACVLLVVAANLTNLLLVRALARSREMALRAALGASRGRIVRQLVTEAALLVLLGATVGWLLAAWGVQLLRLARPGNLPRIEELRLDSAALAFALGVSLLVALVASLLPAWRASRADLHDAVKSGNQRTGPSRRRTQSALVVAQIALSLTLLIGAVLFVQSFLRLHNASLGFDPRHVQQFRVSPPAARYPTLRHHVRFYDELTGRLAALAGVRQVGVTSAVPFDAATFRMTTRVSARAGALAAGELLSVERFNVGPRYFNALGVALRAGRFFETSDTVGAPPVAILNEAAARRLWPNQDPVGKTVIWNLPLTVVGVVADVKNISLDRSAQPALFVSAGQHMLPTMTVVMSTTGETAGVDAAVRRELRALDAEMPMFDARPLEQLLNEASALPRFNTGLLAGFAAAALLLAALGLYGVVAYTAMRRTGEFGVRIALGAPPREIRWMVLRHGARLAALGTGFGLVLSASLARFMAGLLHETSAMDPFTFAIGASLLMGVALLACWLPARRAAKVDPMAALRTE